MKDILEIVRSLEESGLLFKGVSETIKNEAKKQKGAFFSILLGALGTNLLGKVLAGKGVIRAGEGTAPVGYESKRSSIKRSLSKKKFDPTTSFSKFLNTNVLSK